nr:amidohydrolase family protein [Bacteroidota bacterium]
MLVLKNTSFVDVEKGELVSDVDILILGSLIQDIKRHSPERVYPDAGVIDLEGYFLIPGLIESHTHISSLRSEESLTIALKKGITTLRDMGGDGRYLLDIRQAVKNGEFPGPDIYFSAIMGGRDFIMNDTRVKLSTPPDYLLGEAPWARLIENEENIPQIIIDAKECGATGIKIYAHLSGDLVKKLAVEANANGLKVWAHGVVYPATLEDVINSGVQVISHANSLLLKSDWNLKKDGSLAIDTTLLSSPKLDDIFKTMKERNVYLDPTLVVMKYMTSAIKDEKRSDRIEQAIFSVVRLAHEYGVSIVAGSDTPLPGSDDMEMPLFTEMKLLVNEVGLSTIEALISATLNGAIILGIDEMYGSIQAGKVANIVVLKNDPLENIINLGSVEFVIKDGKIIK